MQGAVSGLHTVEMKHIDVHNQIGEREEYKQRRRRTNQPETAYGSGFLRNWKSLDEYNYADRNQGAGGKCYAQCLYVDVRVQSSDREGKSPPSQCHSKKSKRPIKGIPWASVENIDADRQVQCSDEKEVQGA